jgi:hypothetical protein
MVGAFRLSLLLRRRGPFMVSHLTLPNDADCRPASAPKSVLVARLPLPLDRMCTAIRSPLMKISTVRPVSRTSTSLRAKR